jgi:hypothetical protein
MAGLRAGAGLAVTLARAGAGATSGGSGAATVVGGTVSGDGTASGGAGGAGGPSTAAAALPGDAAGGTTAAGTSAVVVTWRRVTTRYRKPAPFKTTNTIVIAIVRIGPASRKLDGTKWADDYSSMESHWIIISRWHDIVHSPEKWERNHMLKWAWFAQLDEHADSLE